ncbi:(1-_4)-alpha-D-glucan 1-alpha-D-glucosylmutase [Variovorax sp. GrIS 2.14]|uniref:malto-oligosyltrehalose synthase n=1 Tax=Variovorax sp. GrIS 2.14 TaxID=3071709 RepID=UPI0038F72DB9
MSSPRAHSDIEAVQRLCAHFGISTDYHDVWGNHHRVAREHLVGLLAEFDVVLDDTLDATAALDAAQRGDWSETLPPVLAMQAGAAEWSIALRLPATAHHVRWRLEEEGGAVHGGEIDARALPDTAYAELDGIGWYERRLTMTLRLPAGYHRFSIEGATAPHGGAVAGTSTGKPGEPYVHATTLVISAPEHCHRPVALQGEGRIWGPAVQLYSLRSQHNWGIGDFGDLAQLVGIMAERGADIIGLSPLHALFSHNPAHASPYSPSSRQQINVLYIDVQAADEFNACDPARRLVRSASFQSRLADLRATSLVDYPGVAAAKFEVLELLFAHFRAQHVSADGQSASTDSRSTRGEAFFAFVEERGEALRRHALFEALQAHFHLIDDSIWGWPVWPDAYRDPASPEVAAFASEHADRVLFHLYLQWVAVEQLVRVNSRCKALGLGIGLFLDLAVSVDRGGSDVWGEPSAFGAGASVGAPPDEFNPNGQSWGLPPLRPDHLRASGYRIFIETLRANMRGAGALRIDHVMGLMRLFWVPQGRTARDGAYVHYALHEMMAIVALESQRNHCMVVGEDLGTVADEMRAALSRSEVHSYRLLYFERWPNGDFKAPAEYPRHALVAVSTHDLATLAGWWSSHDLRLRWQLGLFPDEQTFEKQLLDRAQERVRLLLAVQHAGLLTGEQVAEATGSQTLPSLAVQAVHLYLAMAPSALMLVQLEDALGSVEQANLPGTTDQQPNWRRKLPIDLDAVGADGDARKLFDAMAQVRPRAAVAGSAMAAGLQTRVPRATYRLQFHKDFGFDDAVRILPYLAQLGVSHVYCSPIQRARAGSMHGYDVVAHDEINPEIGGAEGFARFIGALRQHGLGQLLDMVPNHMGVLGADNAWWLDVLENGQASHFAQHFDIDWQPLNIELTGKVLLPVLGGHYGEVLQNGEIALRFDAAEGSLALNYFEHRFPLAPESYTDVLLAASRHVEDADVAAGAASIASAFGHLPGRNETEPQARAERARDKELLKARLARLCTRSPALTEAIAASVDTVNSDDTRDRLHALIEAQAYRLAYWRVAADEINYRRFFDINDLAALRMERDEVFEDTQSFALDLAAAGVVDGLRIDHPDGLYDPARYFLQLQQGYARRARLTLPDVDVQGRPARPLYVVAEKIAAANEEVPESWHVHGTTGYRFANVANGVLVDAAAGPEVERIWRDFSGVDACFEALSHVGKRDVIRTALASELNVLATELVRLARADRSTRDYTLNALRRALAEVAVCLPVYRTYFVHSASEQDQHFIARAVEEARRQSQDSDLSVFDFVHQSLLGEAVPLASADLQGRVHHFARRFQQFSAPVSAKGVEDTAFYRYFPLSSLNEVGGEPGTFGMTVTEFHSASADRALRWPHTMLATSTHDNKRSEDVRNRIDVLSEMPAAWQAAMTRWSEMNQRVRDRLEAEGAPSDSPSRADEYLLYQTLLGTLPPDGFDDETLAPYAERIVQYLLKAARESKSHTRWTAPNEAYEAALEGFVRGLLSGVQGNVFLRDLQAFGDTVAWLGAWNSITLMLLKYGSPGVPDLYQGNELMDLSLVDPDNRRPVDYDCRQRWLQQLDDLPQGRGLADEVGSLARAPHDGRAKLWVVRRLLALRRDKSALFRDGGYAALGIDGPKSEHALAFERRLDDDVLIVAAVRRFAGLTATTGPENGVPALPGGEVWQGTVLRPPNAPEGSAWENLLTGERLVVEQGALQLSSLFGKFPGAALVPWSDRSA